MRNICCYQYSHDPLNIVISFIRYKNNIYTYLQIKYTSTHTIYGIIIYPSNSSGFKVVPERDQRPPHVVSPSCLQQQVHVFRFLASKLAVF